MSLIEQFQFNFLDDNRWQFILSGLKNTIIITFFAVLLGIFLGFVIAIVRSTHDKTGKLKILNVICRVYLTVIRGTPTMVQLLIVFYVIFATIDPGKIVVAIIAFGMNSAAYVAEIVRSGIMSIDQGQFEAGRSLGLNYTQTMIKIILPQAVKNILPALGNELIVLLKETSISGYIGLMDLTRGGDIIRSQTYSALFPLIPEVHSRYNLFLIYFPSASRLIWVARYPAPNPLSIFTTAIPLAQELIIVRSADNP